MTTQSQKLRAKVDQAILFPEQFEVGVDDHTEVNSLRPETGESTDRPNDTSLMVLPKSAPSTKEQKVYDTAEKVSIFKQRFLHTKKCCLAIDYDHDSKWCES